MLFCRIAMIIIIAMDLGIALGKHGEPKDGRYNFWVSLVGAAIHLLLLWGGGFFS